MSNSSKSRTLIQNNSDKTQNQRGEKNKRHWNNLLKLKEYQYGKTLKLMVKRKRNSIGMHTHTNTHRLVLYHITQT